MTCARMSYDSIFLIIGLYDQPVQIQSLATKTMSLPPSPDPLVSLSSLTVVTTYASPAKISIPIQIYLQNKLCMADPFPLDL